MQAKRLVKTTYEKWMEQQGIPVITGPAVEDVTQVPRKFWPFLGGPAAFINLEGMEYKSGMYVAEVPPGGALNAEKHLYDEVIYVLKGSGFTEIGLKGKKQTFEWKESSLFSPPLNTWHRLVNGTPEPAIILGVTLAPIFMDILHNMDFIFNNDYEFTDRYQEQEDYFMGEGKRYQLEGVGRGIWETNFIPDVVNAPLESFERKVTKGRITWYQISGNALAGHIAEWPAGIYHKAHCHGGGVVLVALTSKGYWLFWPPEAGTKPYQNGRGDEVDYFDPRVGRRRWATYWIIYMNLN